MTLHESGLRPESGPERMEQGSEAQKISAAAIEEKIRTLREDLGIVKKRGPVEYVDGRGLRSPGPIVYYKINELPPTDAMIGEISSNLKQLATDPSMASEAERLTAEFDPLRTAENIPLSALTQMRGNVYSPGILRHRDRQDALRSAAQKTPDNAAPGDSQASA